MNPAIRLSRVVLPHPDGPTTQTISPAATSSETSWKAQVGSPSVVAKIFETRSISISGPVRAVGRGAGAAPPMRDVVGNAG